MADNILGLLFEIGADPSKAEAALAQLRATHSSTLSQMRSAAREFQEDLAGGIERELEDLRAKLAEVSSEGAKALAALGAQSHATADALAGEGAALGEGTGHAAGKPLAAAARDAATAFFPLVPKFQEFGRNLIPPTLTLRQYPALLQSVTQSTAAWSEQTLTSSDAVAGSLAFLARAYERTTEVILHSHAREVASDASRVLALVGHRKAAAIIEAIWQTAEGLASLADHDFWAAAQHFASAAEYGILAGRGGGFGMGGGRTGRAEREREVRRTRALGGETGAIELAGGPARSGIERLEVGTLVVSNLAVSELIGAINQKVIFQDAFLISTRARQATIAGT